jgi:excisionase family DNA binding protein
MAVPARNLHEPVLPSEQEAQMAEQSSRVLASRMGQVESLRLKLDDGTDLILPAFIQRLLLDALVQVSQGNTVTLIPIHAELTTQQAADLLNVSRPYLVEELLEKGKIPFRKVGIRRRVLFKDVMAYKQHIDSARLETLAKMTEHDQQYGFGY